ncbi:uncharacterized protein V1518DRAFT_409977 [Limtongia smithiae]|uniref:uncharacterized protein n=1 Tax=Limtongia smithiae TaxID=1125753 RepID=UPI0034CF1D84
MPHSSTNGQRCPQGHGGKGLVRKMRAGKLLSSEEMEIVDKYRERERQRQYARRTRRTSYTSGRRHDDSNTNIGNTISKYSGRSSSGNSNRSNADSSLFEANHSDFYDLRNRIFNDTDGNGNMSQEVMLTSAPSDYLQSDAMRLNATDGNKTLCPEVNMSPLAESYDLFSPDYSLDSESSFEQLVLFSTESKTDNSALTDVQSECFNDSLRNTLRVAISEFMPEPDSDGKFLVTADDLFHITYKLLKYVQHQ